CCDGRQDSAAVVPARRTGYRPHGVPSRPGGDGPDIGQREHARRGHGRCSCGRRRGARGAAPARRRGEDDDGPLLRVPGVEAVALIKAVLNALSQRVTGPRAGSDCGGTGMIYSVFLLFALNIGWTRQEPIQTGRSQFDAGNYAGAVKTLTVAVANTPKDPAVHYWLARSCYEMRDYDNAIKHAETAVDLSPSNAEYYRWLGRAYGAKAEQS